MRGFCTSARSSKSCRALTSGQLLQRSELKALCSLTVPFYFINKTNFPWLFRTLEFLAKHLAHLATLSAQTNMHARNLALVWAPNLLRQVELHGCLSWSLSPFKVVLTLAFFSPSRCKDMEVSAGNGDLAFRAVRIQQSVVEFILNHTEQIFSSDSALIRPKEGRTNVQRMWWFIV